MKQLPLTLIALLLSFCSFAVAPITGSTSICQGSGSMLSDATPGGIWTSSDMTIATASGTSYGYVTGVAAGTATISYTVGGVYSTTTVTVNAASPITGTNVVCTTLAITLSDAVGGGTWLSSNTISAPIGITSGVVTGTSAGTTNITYTNSYGCQNTLAVSVVSSLPAITGSPTVCASGGTVTLTDIGSGTWSNTGTSVAIVSPGGVVTGIFPGTVTITYTIGASCTAYLTETAVSTPLPITGPSTMCKGSSSTVSDATPGGVWSSSGAVAVGSPSGYVYGTSAGTGTVTYSLGTGCTVTSTITVNPISSITGLSSICVGGTSTLTDAATGGTWTSSTSSVATIGYSTGVVSAVATGTSNIVYTTGAGCTASLIMSVISAPLPITGVDQVCLSTTERLYDGTPGGTWSSSIPGNITISSGLITGVAAGTSTITYSLGGTCYSVKVDTATTTAGPITGTTSLCSGASTTLAAAGGGMWSSSNYSVAYVGTGSSIVTGYSSGTATISYSLGGSCIATITVTVDPSVSASIIPAACGSTDTLSASGCATYSWSPTTGLSCPTCAVTSLDPATTTTYVVTGVTTGGCTSTKSLTVNGNRIYGHIKFSSYTPDTLDMKVWLIQYNPTDSMITATDSVMACTIDSIDYYEFDGQPAGSYLIKAQLLYDNPVGGYGYIPTYGVSSAHWNTATTVTHGSGSDSLHFVMINGTVPPGPGFIGGNVYFGAGKGTSGDLPADGMLIYLENTSGDILGHTYTDASGAYSFGSIAYGDYLIYPEDYGYNTTTSAVLTLSSGNPVISATNFKEYTTSKKIVPIAATEVMPVGAVQNFNLSPNPTNGSLSISWINQVKGSATVVVTDMIGREVHASVLDMNTASGQAQLNLAELNDGIYIINITSDHNLFNGKLIIEK